MQIEDRQGLLPVGTRGSVWVQGNLIMGSLPAASVLDTVGFDVREWEIIGHHDSDPAWTDIKIESKFVRINSDLCRFSKLFRLYDCLAIAFGTHAEIVKRSQMGVTIRQLGPLGSQVEVVFDAVGREALDGSPRTVIYADTWARFISYAEQKRGSNDQA